MENSERLPVARKWSAKYIFKTDAEGYSFEIGNTFCTKEEDPLNNTIKRAETLIFCSLTALVVGCTSGESNSDNRHETGTITVHEIAPQDSLNVGSVLRYKASFQIQNYDTSESYTFRVGFSNPSADSIFIPTDYSLRDTGTVAGSYVIYQSLLDRNSDGKVIYIEFVITKTENGKAVRVAETHPIPYQIQ